MWIERWLLIAALLFCVYSAAIPQPQQFATPVGGPLAPTAGFALNGVYEATSAAGAPPGIPRYGSWTGSDISTGSLTTPWYRANGALAIDVAGYPNHPGLALRVEYRSGRTIRAEAITSGNPGERWTRVTLRRLSGLDEDFRIVAIDNARSNAGWLGFSLPYVESDATIVMLDILVRLIGCSALALCLLYAPGLLLARSSGRLANPSFLSLPGIAWLSAMGFVYWLYGGQPVVEAIIDVALIAPLGIALIAGIAEPLTVRLDAGSRKVLLIAAAVLSVALGRSMFSFAAQGELYEGTISRTFEPGDRPDSRISYHVAQIAVNHIKPYAPAASALFAPWTFSDRGPLAGIAAVPIVLAAHAAVPLGLPEQPWSAFDKQGFEAYRITLFALASSVFLSFFGIVRRIAGEEAGLSAVSIAALSPFVVHEVWFTWPKLFATAIALSAAALFFERRFTACGIVLGVAFLVHPSIAFAWFAFAGAGFLWLAPPPALRAIALLSAGLGYIIVLWRVVNGDHYSQTGFTSFASSTGPYAAGFSGWLHARFDSVVDTIVPLWLAVFHANDAPINAIGRPSSVWVHLGFSYWSTLPFAVGITFAVSFARRGFVAARKATTWFFAVVAIPFVIFALYWGFSTTGLMREGLQWWFFALVGTIVVIEANFRPTPLVKGRFVVSRAIEIGCVAVGFAIVDRGQLVGDGHVFDDGFALVWIAFSIIALGILSRLRTREPSLP